MDTGWFCNGVINNLRFLSFASPFPLEPQFLLGSSNSVSIRLDLILQFLLRKLGFLTGKLFNLENRQEQFVFRKDALKALRSMHVDNSLIRDCGAPIVRSLFEECPRSCKFYRLLFTVSFLVVELSSKQSSCASSGEFSRLADRLEEVRKQSEQLYKSIGGHSESLNDYDRVLQLTERIKSLQKRASSLEKGDLSRQTQKIGTVELQPLGPIAGEMFSIDKILEFTACVKSLRPAGVDLSIDATELRHKIIKLQKLRSKLRQESDDLLTQWEKQVNFAFIVHESPALEYFSMAKPSPKFDKISEMLDRCKELNPWKRTEFDPGQEIDSKFVQLPRPGRISRLKGSTCPSTSPKYSPGAGRPRQSLLKSVILKQRPPSFKQRLEALRQETKSG